MEILVSDQLWSIFTNDLEDWQNFITKTWNMLFLSQVRQFLLNIGHTYLNYMLLAMENNILFNLGALGFSEPFVLFFHESGRAMY